MKIGVLSDTHRIKKCIDEAIPYLKECDLIIHAGDNFEDSKYLYSMTGIGTMAVKGNCDFENIEEELEIDIVDKKIFLCHGDNYGVKYGIKELESKAKKIGADIVIFGHTHTPLCLEKDNILYINPGSVSLPRGVNYRSFVILNIENNQVSVEKIKL